jgi:energy-coupling factor transporter ATP-binding protein EcfA2
MSSAIGAEGNTKRREPLLWLAEVQKSFDRLEAIRNISVEVGDGEFVGIFGPSGCGKSTLLMMIAGLAAPSSGVIVIGREQVAGPRHRCSCAVLSFGRTITMRRPSGQKAALRTSPSWRSDSPTGSPVSVSQTRAELSLIAMRMWRPIPGRGIGCTRSGLDRPKIG